MNSLEILYNTTQFYFNSNTKEVVPAKLFDDFVNATEAIYSNDENTIMDIYGHTIHALDEFFHDESVEIRCLNNEKDRLLIFNKETETTLLAELVDEEIRYTITRG